MELKNEVDVSSPVEDVWEAFNDVERIAPCLPGAQLQEIEGDEYRGIVKVKVGPITAQYKGKASFVEQNRDDLRVVIQGDGRDSRGAGNASALITAQLEPVSDSVTKVKVDTDLKVTGKVAQFGRGVMADVSAKLMQQFAENFEAMMEEGKNGGTGEADEAVEEPEPQQVGAVRKLDMPEPEAVDLLEHAGTPVLKRALPALGLIFVLLVLRRLLRSRKD